MHSVIYKIYWTEVFIEKGVWIYWKKPVSDSLFLIKLQVSRKTQVFSSYYRTPLVDALGLAEYLVIHSECINRKWWNSNKHSGASCVHVKYGLHHNSFVCFSRYMFELENEYKQVNRKNIVNEKKKSVIRGFIN